MKNSRSMVLAFAFLSFIAVSCTTLAAECIVPARPQGGFDLTCRLMQTGLSLVDRPGNNLKIVVMPGGVGAIGFSAIVSRRPAEPDTLVAFSGGSVLNLAQGRFGKHTEQDVRWLAAIGIDYGVLVVRSDSPYTSLESLMSSVKHDPREVVFGGSGTTGSQDWTKLALLARIANMQPGDLRFVGFEGGGDSFSALLGRYVDVVSGDLSEALNFLRQGMPLRILAVMSRTRLPGTLLDVPTATEQGYELEWSNIRGVYMGPHVSDSDYQRWVSLTNKMLNHPQFLRMREEAGLQPYAKTGDELTADIRQLSRKYRCIAVELATTARNAKCSELPGAR